MNTLTRTKPHFPLIQPDMLQRLTQEADQRTSDDGSVDWDDLKHRIRAAAPRTGRA